MDLGATICRPRAPDCAACPLQPRLRRLRQRHSPKPSRAKAKAARPHRHGIAYWIERDGCVWLVRRPAKGHARRHGRAARAASGPTRRSSLARRSATVRHVFTHFALDLAVVARAEPTGRRLVAAARPTRRGRPADPLPPSRRGGPCVGGARLPPEPFFSGPGLDRADHLRADPRPASPSCCARRARQLSGADGLPAARRGRTARLGTVGDAADCSSASDGDAALLRLAGDAPSSARGVSAARPARSQRRGADLRARAQPRRLALPPSFLRQLRRDAHRSIAAAGRGAARVAAPSISRASTRS